MAKKNLEEKIKDVVFYAIIFFILYLILGFLIKSEWLTSFTQSWVYTYELLRDAFTLTAYFLAPAAAFVLFSDWREQHNKRVINEFALKVFRQFELFEKAIQEANIIYIELDNILPDESRHTFNDERVPIYLNNNIFKKNHDLILSFFPKIMNIQEVFNILLDDIRYFGIVANKMEEISIIVKYLIVKFEEISTVDEDDDSYSEYLQFLEIIAGKIDSYQKLRNDVSNLIIVSLLMTLKAD